VSGVGGYPFVGTPDKVAEEFANIARAGVRGIAISFVNYLSDVPYFYAEVLPRLRAWAYERQSTRWSLRSIASSIVLILAAKTTSKKVTDMIKSILYRLIAFISR